MQGVSRAIQRVRVEAKEECKCSVSWFTPLVIVLVPYLHYLFLQADKRTLEMESNLVQIVEETVIIETYPRAEISIVVHVLESDG